MVSGPGGQKEFYVVFIFTPIPWYGIILGRGLKKSVESSF